MDSAVGHNFKHNCDRVVVRHAACSGMLCDHNGMFICVFASSLELCSIAHVELCAIFICVKLALDKGCQRSLTPFSTPIDFACLV